MSRSGRWTEFSHTEIPENADNLLRAKTRIFLVLSESSV